MIEKIKRYAIFILPVIGLSMLVLWPSFNLHLTGDDYLGLWRYIYYINGHTTGKWNNFNFFFTDYGPQDTYTAIIHYFVGFQPRYYYAVNYLLRLLAAFSFFPLVNYLTKNRWAAYVSILFFSITTSGLETTDWSFNMPSYTAIAFLNIFLYVYLKAKENRSFKLSIIAFLLFYLTMVMQPIRMTFLPLLMLVIEGYSIFRDHTKIGIAQGTTRIAIFVVIAAFFYLTGFVGNSVGAGETFTDRVNGGWLKVIGNNAAQIKPYLEKGEYKVLAYPIAQLGSVLFPTNLIPQNYQENTVTKALFKLAIPLFILFSTLVLLYQKELLSFLKKKPIKKASSKRKRGTQKIAIEESNRRNIFWIIAPILAAGIWTTYSYITFIQYSQYLLNKSQFISLLVGGYALILLGLLFFKYYRKEKVALGIVIGTALTILAFITPWSRNPTFLFDTYGRYLIVPGAGLSLIVGMILGSPRTSWTKFVSYILVLGILLIHMFASFQYIYHLSTVRGIAMTEKIRNSVPKVAHANDSNIPIMVYVEPKDNEVLHHSLVFGFPVIMGFQYNYFNVWHIANTDRWEEVEAAYRDGSSLKRFSIPVKKVRLENIYSFWLDTNNVLHNTTNETRKRLLEKEKQENDLKNME